MEGGGGGRTDEWECSYSRVRSHLSMHHHPARCARPKERERLVPFRVIRPMIQPFPLMTPPLKSWDILVPISDVALPWSVIPVMWAGWKTRRPMSGLETRFPGEMVRYRPPWRQECPHSLAGATSWGIERHEACDTSGNEAFRLLGHAALRWRHGTPSWCITTS
jgi:hypothetical protein